MSGSVILNLISRLYGTLVEICRSSASWRLLAAADRMLIAATRSSYTAIKLVEQIPARYFDSSRVSSVLTSLVIGGRRHSRLTAAADSSRFMNWAGRVTELAPGEAISLLSWLAIAMLSGNLVYHIFYDYELLLIVIDGLLLVVLALLHGMNWEAAWAGCKAAAGLDWILDIQDKEKDGMP